MLTLGPRAQADVDVDAGIGIGGVRTGGTAMFLAAGLATRVTDDIVVGGRMVGGVSGPIDITYQPEHARLGFVGPSVTWWIDDVAFAGGAVGLSVFDAGPAAARAAIELRAGAMMRFGVHEVMFAIESVTPIQGSPVPAIAFLVEYGR